MIQNLFLVWSQKGQVKDRKRCNNAIFACKKCQTVAGKQVIINYKLMIQPR